MTLLTYYPVTQKKYSGYNADNSWTPAVDIIENTDGFALEIDLPGFKKNDFTLTVKEGVLTVSGERKSEKPADDKLYRYYERPYGVFERSFKLPELVEHDNIKASYKNGVLKLNFQKKEETKPRSIHIV